MEESDKVPVNEKTDGNSAGTSASSSARPEDLHITGSQRYSLGRKIEFNRPVTIVTYVNAKKSDGQHLKEGMHGMDENVCEEMADNIDAGPPASCELPEVLQTKRCPCPSTIQLGNVTVDDSSYAHFGNEVHFNGPVVIKEYISQGVKKPVEKPAAGENPSPVTFAERFLRRAQWFGLPPRGELIPLKQSPVGYVVIAHTGGPHFQARTASINTMRSIQYNSFVKNLHDICYNFVVGGDGHIYEGCGWDQQGVFSERVQSESICIAFMGDFMLELPPKKMIEAAFCLLEEGVRIGKVSPDYKLLIHKQVHNTESPGMAFIEIIKKWPHFSYFE